MILGEKTKNNERAVTRKVELTHLTFACVWLNGKSCSSESSHAPEGKVEVVRPNSGPLRDETIFQWNGRHCRKANLKISSGNDQLSNPESEEGNVLVIKPAIKRRQTE